MSVCGIHRLQEVGLWSRENKNEGYESSLRPAEREVAIMQATGKEAIQDRVTQVRIS
jgi:hypothetical protein